jgi:peptide/nickel transport system permease protein
MTRFIARRVLLMIPLLLGISFMVFALLNLVPGSPITNFEFNPNITPADLARIKTNLGLDAPWYERYFIWLGNAVQGDFGNSLINYTPVWYQLQNALPNTLLLSATSLVFAILFSIPLGVISAVKRNSLFDRITIVLTTGFNSVPSIWLGLLAIILFSVKFQEWGLPSLPTGGVKDLRGGGGFWDRLEHLLMPAIVVGLVSLAGWTRYIRSSMLEVIRQDYVRTASAKGLKNKTVLMGHAFRNAMLPLITLIGLTIPDVFGGALIIENVFAYPGIGRLTVNSLQQNDYTIAMACVMMFAVLTLVGNLIADVLYGVMDPRVRFD